MCFPPSVAPVTRALPVTREGSDELHKWLVVKLWLVPAVVCGSVVDLLLSILHFASSLGPSHFTRTVNFQLSRRMPHSKGAL